MMKVSASLLLLATAITLASAACISSGDQNTINQALSSGGKGTLIQLCPSAVITISDAIVFTDENQEISTEGYPTGDTRAIIQLDTKGGSATTLIQGGGNSYVRVLNVQIDGQRSKNGFQHDGGANIEFGGAATGQIVRNVASRNPRAWSCMHFIESGDDSNLCRNATISDNDIGPCGEEGTDSQGNGMWADGISMACTDTMVTNNKIYGPTDGGIVCFGAPGSKFIGNSITGSPTNKGFGAINMVDADYNGNYSGVVVQDNHITAGKLFAVGIAIGPCVWFSGDACGTPNTGPAVVSDNTLEGNITFAIPINGWQGGLTVSGNDVSGVHSPNSDFSDDVQCSAPVQQLFEKNDKLPYYPAGLTGPRALQNGYVEAQGDPKVFICPTGPLSTSKTFSAGELNMGPGTVIDLHGGISVQYQVDNNLVVYQTNGANNVPVFSSGHTVSSCGAGECFLTFGDDGDLKTTVNGATEFSTGTSGKGKSLTFLNEVPYVKILDAQGNIIFSAVTKTPVGTS